MPDIIQSWLGKKLGVIIDMSPENFGRNMKDGKLLARVLYSYGIITPEILDSIKPAKYINECYNNILILKPWLEYLGVQNLDVMMKEMASGCGSSALQIFYSLYLILESKDALYYMSDQKEKKFKRDIKVDWVPEMEIRQCVPFYDSELAGPLTEKKEMIDWHRKKCKDVSANINKVKQKFADTVKGMNKDFPVVSRSVKPKLLPKKINEVNGMRKSIYCFEKNNQQKVPDMSYQELLELKSKTTPVKPSLKEARNYVNFIKQKTKKGINERMFQQKMSNLMADELLRNLIEVQENEFDEKVCANILKQSQYEKQMCSKLFLARHQKKVLAENRKMIEKLILNEREKEFLDVLNRRLDLRAEDAGEADFEKERLAELHRRMYGEKTQMKFANNLRECQSILHSLIDIAIRCGEYREFHDCQVPKYLMKDMKELFFKNLPIFDLMEDVETLCENSCEDENIDYICSSVEGLEQERQSVLDECDLNDYLLLLGPWMVELLLPDFEGLENEQIVLGHIVYTLLEMKYPLPPDPVPADIKPMNPAAVIRDLTDPKALEMLSDLMAIKKILIVSIDDVINFILSAYKDELSVVRDIDINFQKATKASLKEKEPEKKKQSKKEALSKKEPLKKVESTSVEEPLYKDQEIQTPRNIPEEDPLLTPTAELGKIAFECLGLGETVPDSVIVSGIIAYVVSKQDEYNGWILLNYPQTYLQASKLESLLTGYKLLHVDEDTGKGHPRRSSSKDPFEDVYSHLRISKLVPMPEKPDPPEPKTYFSIFIRMKKSRSSKGDLEDFYSQQNVLHEFEYSSLSFQTIKDLAKAILGEVPREENPEIKSSVEIFGEEILELNEKYAVKKESKKPTGKSQKLAPEIVAAEVKSELKVKSSSSVKESSIGEIEKSEVKIKKSEAPSVKPGDPDWPWVPATQSEEILLALADFWQNTEAVYIEDLKQIFFCLRVHYSKAAMYMTYVKSSLRTFMRRPDDKPALLNEFQLLYNSVDQDLRPDIDIKCELHSRVDKFEATLLEIADDRKEVSEEERIKVVNDTWVCDELAVLINYYLMAMQLECDRCIDTCQIINDYYLTLQDKTPEEKVLSKILLPKLKILDKKYSIVSDDSRESNFGSRISIQSSQSRRRRYSENPFLVGACEVICGILKNFSLPEDRLTPFHYFFSDNVERAGKEIISVVEGLISQTKRGEKSTKDKKKTAEKDFGNQIAQEWTMALEDELNRFSFRAKLIRIRGLLDIDELLSRMMETFSILSEEIGTLFTREVKSIMECCKVFRCAIEEEIPIQPKLELEIDEFIVNWDVILFEKPPEPSKITVNEILSEAEFTIEQLINIFEKLNRVAPDGEIIRRAFMYILEDLRVLKIEDNSIKPLPDIWDFLDPDDLTNVFDEIYQKLEIVSWKDFIIYNLNFPYPTEKELLLMREQFKEFDYECKNLIHIDDCRKIDFWFILKIGRNHRTLKAKDLLLKMYMNEDGYVDYFQLLLAFCKDQDPAIGFAKALALSSGKKIIIRNYDENIESEEEKYEFAFEIVSELLGDAIQFSDGVLVKEIHEYTDEESRKSMVNDVASSKSILSTRYSVEGEGYGFYPFKRYESSKTSVIEMDIASNVIISSYPSLPKLTLLLNSERTLQETLKTVYESLEKVNDKFQVYHLLQHPFIFRLLTGTNKFKIIDVRSLLIEQASRKCNC